MRRHLCGQDVGHPGGTNGRCDTGTGAAVEAPGAIQTEMDVQPEWSASHLGCRHVARPKLEEKVLSDRLGVGHGHAIETRRPLRKAPLRRRRLTVMPHKPLVECEREATNRMTFWQLDLLLEGCHEVDQFRCTHDRPQRFLVAKCALHG